MHALKYSIAIACVFLVLRTALCIASTLFKNLSCWLTTCQVLNYYIYYTWGGKLLCIVLWCWDWYWTFVFWT